MSEKLLLLSSFEDVAPLLSEFEKEVIGKKVTFIPTASVVEEVVFYVETGKKALEELGLIVEELELSTANAEEIKEKITRNDMIYVTGGNAFFLLQEMRRTGADKLIAEEVRLGKLYIGESAGAVVVSPNIGYTRAMDNPEAAPNLTDFTGLELVPFYTVPHYNNQPFEKIAHEIVEKCSTKLPLKVISNNELIFVDGRKIEIKANEK